MADGDARYRLLYEESVRALEDQQTALDELRSRTGVLLSAASISTSFLGGLALRAGTLETPGWVAIGAFVATAIFVCLILIPTRWTFHVDIQALGSSYLVDEPGADLDEMHWNLAIYRQESFDTNAPRFGRLFFAFRSASMLLVLEVVAWLIDFAVR